MSPHTLLRPALLPALLLTVSVAATTGGALRAHAAEATPAETTFAEASPAEATPAGETAPAAAAARTQAASAPAALSPMHQEIRALLERQQVEVETLAAQIAQERDPQRALELQRAVEASKRNVQVGVLEVQLRHARAVGKAEAVSALELALNQMLRPEVAAKPQVRPAAAEAGSRP